VNQYRVFDSELTAVCQLGSHCMCYVADNVLAAVQYGSNTEPVPSRGATSEDYEEH